MKTTKIITLVFSLILATVFIHAKILNHIDWSYWTLALIFLPVYFKRVASITVILIFVTLFMLHIVKKDYFYKDIIKGYYETTTEEKRE